MEELVVFVCGLILSCLWFLRASVLYAQYLCEEDYSILRFLNKSILFYSLSLITFNIFYHLNWLHSFFYAFLLIFLKFPKHRSFSLISSVTVGVFITLIMILVHHSMFGWLRVHSIMASISLLLMVMWVGHALIYTFQDRAIRSKSINLSSPVYPPLQYAHKTMLLLSFITGGWIVLVLLSGGMLMSTGAGLWGALILGVFLCLSLNFLHFFYRSDHNHMMLHGVIYFGYLMIYFLSYMGFKQ